MEAEIGGDAPGLLLGEPLGYLDFLSLMADAGAVLTDSGGIQEETTYLGVPCFTLRDNTERPVTIRAGTNTLLGLDPAAIGKIPAALAESRRGAERAAAALGRPRRRAPRRGRREARLAGQPPRRRRQRRCAGSIVAGRPRPASCRPRRGLRRSFARGKQHAHVAAFLQRRRLDHGEFAEILEEPLKQVPAPVRVGLLAAAEHDRDLDLVLVA